MYRTYNEVLRGVHNEALRGHLEARATDRKTYTVTLTIELTTDKTPAAIVAHVKDMGDEIAGMLEQVREDVTGGVEDVSIDPA